MTKKKKAFPIDAYIAAANGVPGAATALAEADAPHGAETPDPAPAETWTLEPMVKPAAETAPKNGAWARAIEQVTDETPPEPMEFALWENGRLDIYDGNELFTMPASDVSRLRRFLGCFQEVQA